MTKVEKIPGGISVDGLELKNGKCGCTTVLPCCYSWSKVKRGAADHITFILKATGPDTRENFTWGYMVKKDGMTVEISAEDARDKEIFSGFYPPRIEEWTGKGWEIAAKTGNREDFGLWRCAACRRLYKNASQPVRFENLPENWKCPVCGTGKGSFEQAG